MVLLFLIILAFLAVAILRETEAQKEAPPPLAGQCPGCAAPVEGDWLVCPRCRDLVRESCPACGKHRATYHRFCPHCGIHRGEAIP
jgi:hypothetical protein